MTGWIEVTDDFKIRCIKKTKSSDRKYCYEYMVDGETIPAETNSNPLSLNSNVEFFKLLKNNVTSQIKQEIAETLNIPFHQIKKELYEDRLSIRLGAIKKELNDNIVLEDDLIERENIKKTQSSDREISEKYDELYSEFQVYCDEDGNTPLREVIAIAHCLGVGEPREIVRAWLGYVQTYLGLKASNVIAVGSPASGKSFVLETALSMIPDECVHRGIPSVAYFFRKFNGMDLTGHIFYLGDLGGERDNEDTIAVRDLLKQLTTDGYVERGIVNSKDMSDETQFVQGKPCLSYSTANEKIINDQEKSRSIILTPDDPDYKDITVFKSIVENKGDFASDLEMIDRKRESIKGLVYHYLDEEFDFFNPYLYIVAEFLKDNYDFNRKIDEFNAILKLVTMFDEPYVTEYEYTSINEMEEVVSSTSDLYIARRKHNRDSLKIFSTSNFLPDEVSFGNGILKNIPRFQLDFLDTVNYGLYNLGDMIKENQYGVEDYISMFINDTIESENGNVTINLSKNVDLNSNGEFTDIREYLFTKKTLKDRFRNHKWYAKSRDYIDERIRLLNDENIILKIGKDTGNYNVYCVNPFQEDLIDDEKLKFLTDDINEGVDLFRMNYSSLIDEFCEFVQNDDTVEDAGIFEVVKPVVAGLPFNRG